MRLEKEYLIKKRSKNTVVNGTDSDLLRDPSGERWFAAVKPLESREQRRLSLVMASSLLRRLPACRSFYA